MSVTYCTKCGLTVRAPISTHVCESPKPQTLYAFWDYDMCPYVLGGQVVEFKDNGRVKVKGYDGMSFKPIAILPGKAGVNALIELKKLRSQYDSAEKDLKYVYASAAKKILLGG